MQADILLTTLNSRYMHTAFALRYIYANLGELKAQAQIKEFTIQQRAIDIVEQLLVHEPKLIGFSTYIWNATETAECINLLKQIAPEVIVFVGGPEVSHPPDLPDAALLADYVITGAGEKSVKDLCEQVLNERRPEQKVIKGIEISLEHLEMPYELYTDEDIKNRLIYVEASRGCPFKCEFCLSSLDKTAKPFSLDNFLNELDQLIQRGARNFKFIDRTFNLKVSTSIAILDFFLERMTDDMYLHFELVPDHLPEKLKSTLKKFPENSLQFEIGIQTFDPNIQELISRKQNNEKSKENIQWLRENTGAHLHTDLIFGLPGDTLENFAESFNQLIALNPQEIQLGILKRLRGAPLNRHNEEYQLKYNPKPPYNILTTRDIDFASMQRVNRFARYWDMLGNSGRFNNSLELILGDNPFKQFMQISDELYKLAGATWKIGLKRQFELLYQILTETLHYDKQEVETLLMKDFLNSGEKGQPNFMQQQAKVTRIGVANKRQKQHQKNS